MLMVLMVIWYFGIFQVEDLVESTWVHHFVVVQLFNFDYGHHQSHFCFVESNFGLESLFIVHVESPVVCSPLLFHTWCTH